MKNKEKYASKEKEKAKIKKLHGCKRVFQEMWEFYNINSLGDSHFQTYVMNNVEIVLIFYLRITL